MNKNSSSNDTPCMFLDILFLLTFFFIMVYRLLSYVVTLLSYSSFSDFYQIFLLEVIEYVWCITRRLPNNIWMQCINWQHKSHPLASEFSWLDPIRVFLLCYLKNILSIKDVPPIKRTSRIVFMSPDAVQSHRLSLSCYKDLKLVWRSNEHSLRNRIKIDQKHTIHFLIKKKLDMLGNDAT